MTRKRNLTLYILVILAFLPVALNRDFNYMNELRYLSIADESLADGHLFTFYNQGEPYADKPPLYLWLVMLGKAIFGHHSMVWLSLMSLIPALVVCNTMWRLTRRSMAQEMQTTAQLMLIACGLFTGLIFVLRMDMMMTMWIVLSMYVLYEAYEGRMKPSLWRWLFPLLIFLGIFTKGPMGILIPLTGSVAFFVSRKPRLFWRYWGWSTWGIILALCIVWWGGVYLEGGRQYIDNLLVHQTVGRAVNSFHHARPWWYYFKLIFLLLLPWTPLMVGVWIAAAKRHLFNTSLDRLLICTALFGFIMLTCMSSKLAVYLLPLFPFILYSAAIHLCAFLRTRWVAWCVGVPCAILVFGGPLTLLAPRFGFQLPEGAWMPAVAISFGSLLALIATFKRQNLGAIRILSFTILTAIFLAGINIGPYNPWLGYGAVASEASQMAQETGKEKVYAYGISRPENMDVYLGHDIEIIPSAPVRVADGVVIMRTTQLDSLGWPVKIRKEVGPFSVVTLQTPQSPKAISQQ